MVLHIISTVLNTKFCRPVDMICRKIVSIIYNPYMLITIYILGHTTFRFFEQAERIVSFSKNIQLNWMYPKKVDKCVRIRDKKKQKGKTHMPNKNSPTKYSEEFKKTIVTLYQSGKTYAEIKKEYGVSSSALSNWVRKYSQVQVDEDTVLTAQQIKALQRRNAELEEENLILKKAIAIFTPHSDKD